MVSVLVEISSPGKQSYDVNLSTDYLVNSITIKYLLELIESSNSSQEILDSLDLDITIIGEPTTASLEDAFSERLLAVFIDGTKVDNIDDVINLDSNPKIKILRLIPLIGG